MIMPVGGALGRRPTAVRAARAAKRSGPGSALPPPAVTGGGRARGACGGGNRADDGSMMRPPFLLGVHRRTPAGRVARTGRSTIEDGDVSMLSVMTRNSACISGKSVGWSTAVNRSPPDPRVAETRPLEQATEAG